MPNSKHVPECPYYEYEKKGFIKCEDCKRTFRYDSQKEKWMEMYCDSDWEGCMYAKDLNKAYEENLDMDEQKYKALKSEYRKLELRLGRLEKRISEKDAEIKELKRVKNLMFNDRKLKLKQVEDLQQHNKKLYDEVVALGDFYEARFAYLMSEYADCTLSDKEVEEWAEGKEYAIASDVTDENGKTVQWRVYVREAEDDKNDNSPGAEDKEEQSADIPEERKTIH